MINKIQTLVGFKGLWLCQQNINLQNENFKQSNTYYLYQLSIQHLLLKNLLIIVIKFIYSYSSLRSNISQKIIYNSKNRFTYSNTCDISVQEQ